MRLKSELYKKEQDTSIFQKKDIRNQLRNKMS